MAGLRTEGFARALKDPGVGAPDGLHGPSDRRFRVHSNTVAAGRISALEAQFPAVLDLVGSEFFRATARAFFLAYPPASPRLTTVGERFPDFLAGFEPALQFPYLADVARIEVARVRAYHAADTPRLGIEAFSSVAADAIEDLRIELHPAVAIVRSAHSAFTVFSMATGATAPTAIPQWHAEDCLIDRPEFDPIVQLLVPGMAVFLHALQHGATLAVATVAASESTAGFDLSEALATVIGGRLAVHLSTARRDQ